jgi:hypothetical protein
VARRLLETQIGLGLTSVRLTSVEPRAKSEKPEVVPMMVLVE